MRACAVLLTLLPFATQDAEPLSKKVDRLLETVNRLDPDRIDTPGRAFRDLPPDAAPLLRKALERGDLHWTARACIAVGLRHIDQRARGLGWAAEYEDRRTEFRRLLSGEYDRVSARDPKWTVNARDAVAACVDYWGGQHLRRPEDALKTLRLAEAAIKEGCNDALVLYIAARMGVDTGRSTPENSLQAHKAAAAALDASQYHPLLRGHSHKTLADLLRKAADKNRTKEARDEIVGHLRKAIDLVCEAIGSDPKLMTAGIVEQTGEILSSWATFEDRKTGFDRFHAAALKAQPDGALPDLMAGLFYVRYAWDARGSGWASEVLPENWAKFRDRLGEARRHLEAAWKKDPTQVSGPAEMLPVTMGDSKGREEMERWFARGVQANPDYYSLYSSKLLWLEPKWHGSGEEMLSFGRECVLTGNWDASIPWILLEAHRTLARYTRKGWQEQPDMAYFAKPEVWEDLKGLFTLYLKTYPHDIYWRATCAYYAGYAGRFKEAHEQFKILGDSPSSLGAFSTKADYDRAKKAAADAVAPSKDF